MTYEAWLKHVDDMCSFNLEQPLITRGSVSSHAHQAADDTTTSGDLDPALAVTRSEQTNLLSVNFAPEVSVQLSC